MTEPPRVDRYSIQPPPRKLPLAWDFDDLAVLDLLLFANDLAAWSEPWVPAGTSVVISPHLIVSAKRWRDAAAAVRDRQAVLAAEAPGRADLSWWTENAARQLVELIEKRNRAFGTPVPSSVRTFREASESRFLKGQLAIAWAREAMARPHEPATSFSYGVYGLGFVPLTAASDDRLADRSVSRLPVGVILAYKPRISARFEEAAYRHARAAHAGGSVVRVGPFPFGAGDARPWETVRWDDATSSVTVRCDAPHPVSVAIVWGPADRRPTLADSLRSGRPGC